VYRDKEIDFDEVTRTVCNSEQHVERDVEDKMKRTALVVALTLAGVASLPAQYASLTWLKVSISSTEVDSLTFGIDSRATYGLDTELGEEWGACDLPPVPQGWAVWMDPRGTMYGGAIECLLPNDIRPLRQLVQVDTFELNAIPEVGWHLNITWPDSAAIIYSCCDSIIMQDIVTGGLAVNVNMVHTRSITISNTNINDLLIYRYTSFCGDAVSPRVASLPSRLTLFQNHPNPFNPITQMSFVTGSSSFVTLKVFDVLGREVATLVNEVKPPGMYTATWDASNIPSGVYFYRLQTKEFTQTRKLLLLK
jgi:hypothetical protein